PASYTLSLHDALPIFYGADGTFCIFSIVLFVIQMLHLAGHRKINKLTYRHSFVDTHRMHTGNFESPGIAKTHISLTCSGMNIYRSEEHTSELQSRENL